jgi:hypothetical protein
MKKSRLLGAVCACALTVLAATAHSGSVKKWVDADGNVTFGDAPPPSVTNSEKIKVQESYSPSAPSHNTPSAVPSAPPVSDDYYRRLSRELSPKV